MALLPSGAAASPVDPVLRRSEQLDSRRLGRVSENERSVLRVEWRAALTADAEAHAVQDMLDRLARMDATMGEVGRLLRAIPAPAAAAPAPEAELADWQLALAGLLAAGLLTFWWLRRRNNPEFSEPPPMPRYRSETPPAFRPRPTAPSAPANPPPSVAAAAAAPEPLVLGDTAPAPASSAASAEIAPAPQAAQPAADSPPAETPPAAAAADQPPVIDFLLEDADPEWVADKNTQPPASASLPGFPRIPEENSVAPALRNSAVAEPTLENFAHVMRHVQQIWSQPTDAIAYLRHLLEDNRDGTPAGFPRPVAEEILLLSEILKETADPATDAAAQPDAA